MLIAIMKNESLTVGDYRELFPSTSFPAGGPSPEWMAEQGWPVTVFKLHDRETQRLEPCDPYIEDGQVFTVRVVDLDAETAAANAEAARKARVPATITIRQAKLVLHHAGLLDDVDAAVAGADKATQLEWEYATEVKRDWPTLVAMATALGMTDTQLDDLFIQGSKL